MNTVLRRSFSSGSARMARTVLITGATGKQGGAVINSLLAGKGNLEILAVTRNASSSSAQKLAQKSSNIKLITGDLNNADDIFRKAKEISSSPVWGVYSVQVSDHVFQS
jgi:nucleoside-diphosphate-sugar epimerase